MNDEPRDLAAEAELTAMLEQWHLIKRPRQLVLPTVPFAAGVLALYTGPCWLLGWSVVNTSAGALQAVIIDGPDATGQQVGGFALAAGAAETRILPQEGYLCRGGVAISVTGAGGAGGVIIRPAHAAPLG